eukprot:4339584-Prymnesium_polylepis.2
MFRNRLFVVEKYDPRQAPFERKNNKVMSYKARQKWRLADSVWAPRAREGNCKDFLETEEGLSRMFRVDWEFAIRGHGLEKWIMKNDDEAHTWRDSDGNNIHDEVDEVFQTLDKYKRTIYGAFDYYCCITAEDELGSKGRITYEADVFNMSFNAYQEFAREMNLYSKTLRREDHGVIFSQINSVEWATKDLDKNNKLRAFNRQEFVQALVRIAIAKYVICGRIPDISDACEQLMRVDLGGRLPPEALQNSNTFRLRCCYTEKVDQALLRHMTSLRKLYKHYSQVNQNLSDVLNSMQLMSVGEWMCVCDHLGLFATEQITPTQARLIFMWSRHRAVDDYSDESEIRLRHMFFEDFMEGMLRVATMMALPNDDDLSAMRCKDAGEYLLAMQETSPNEFKNFVKTRRQDWDKPPRQAVGRCFQHLMDYTVRLIERSVGSKRQVDKKRDSMQADGTVDDREVTKFIARGGRMYTNMIDLEE